MKSKTRILVKQREPENVFQNPLKHYAYDSHSQYLNRPAIHIIK
jgi:hypothetical protein